MRRVATVLVLLGFSSLWAGKASAEICWIDHIQRTDGGLQIFFSNVRFLHLIHIEDKPRHYEGNDPVERMVHEGEIGQTFRTQKDAPVNAVLGDKIFSQNSPEDSCSMEVLVRDGQLGLQVTASFHSPLHGDSGSDVSRFIPGN